MSCTGVLRPPPLPRAHALGLACAVATGPPSYPAAPPFHAVLPATKLLPKLSCKFTKICLVGYEKCLFLDSAVM